MLILFFLLWWSSFIDRKELFKFPGYEFSVRIYEYFLLLLFSPLFWYEEKSEGGEERALGEGDD